MPPRADLTTLTKRRAYFKLGTCAADSRYELLFPCLFSPGRGYAFPCDAKGNVVIDNLCNRSRDNYFYARAVVGKELSAPTIRVVA